jgi:probable phosphomutase (TIGR03848 family)
VTEKTTRLLLVRHGMNDYITSRKLAGWTPEVHLNEAGRAQARALAARLACAPIVAVYSSPLERAFETAEFIAAPHGRVPAVLDGLGETRCGEWTGQAIEELSKTDLWRQIQVYPSGTRFPGGETMTEVQVRMVTQLEALRAAHPEEMILVVSHSDPIKVALAHYLGLHIDHFQRLVIEPASLSELAFTPYGPKLIRCNDCSHHPPEIQVG